jgi:hypothetical protein
MTHVLIHCTCKLVIAKEWLPLLPLKPVLELGLWGEAIGEEEANKLVKFGEVERDKVCLGSNPSLISNSTAVRSLDQPSHVGWGELCVKEVLGPCKPQLWDQFTAMRGGTT